LCKKAVQQKLFKKVVLASAKSYANN
jgi:hypothetical protein